MILYCNFFILFCWKKISHLENIKNDLNLIFYTLYSIIGVWYHFDIIFDSVVEIV